MLNYVIWNVNPDIFSLGPLTIRWYGLLWALPFVLGYVVLGKMFRKEGIKTELIDTLTIYVAIGAILGSRLGHCFFYEPQYYLQNPLEILKVWHGGLASHGGGIGVIISLILFSRKYKKSFYWLGDKLVIMAALAAFTIRTGNLMNSEIYGNATENTYGFIYARYVSEPIKASNIVEDVRFRKGKTEENKLIDNKYVPVEIQIRFKKRNFSTVELEHFIETRVSKLIAENGYTKEINFYHDLTQPIDYKIEEENGVYTAKIQTAGIPHHPTQLYEGLSYLLLFIVLLYLANSSLKIPNGLMAGFLVVLLFIARFVIEFVKEPQVEFEKSMSLNMGQWLSIPFILFGIFLIYDSLKNKNYTSEPNK